jgi:hypothetical protein
MRNKQVFAGMLALVLVFGLIVMGCPTDGGTEEENNVTKFEGTWRNYYSEGDEVRLDISYTFKNNTFTARDDTPGNEAGFSGTFTFTENTITFNAVSINTSWTQQYTLTDTVLNLVRDEPGGHYSGDFQKQ